MFRKPGELSSETGLKCTHSDSRASDESWMPVIAFSRIIIRFDNSMKGYCFRLAFEESYRPICSSNKDFNSKTNDTSWEMPPILFFSGQIKPLLYTNVALESDNC